MPHTWTVVWKGREGFVRTGENEAFTLDVADQGAVPAALKLALEHARTAGSDPQAVVVRCSRQAAPPDIGAWSTALGVPVEEGPEWEWTDAQRRPELDLLQGEFAARRGASPILQRLRRPAIMAAALLALGSLAIAVDWAAKARERKALLGEMLVVFRETFGEESVVVDAPLQMNRALADLRQQAGRIGPADFPALLALATEHLLDSARHRIDGIAYENAVLTLTLRPAAGQQPAVLLKELRAKTLPPAYDLLLDEVQSSGTITLRLRPRQGS
jgi:general secretion pathway protein L